LRFERLQNRRTETLWCRDIRRPKSVNKPRWSHNHYGEFANHHLVHVEIVWLIERRCASFGDFICQNGSKETQARYLLGWHLLVARVCAITENNSFMFVTRTTFTVDTVRFEVKYVSSSRWSAAVPVSLSTRAFDDSSHSRVRPTSHANIWGIRTSAEKWGSTATELSGYVPEERDAMIRKI
jgi:hypothetical protein